MSNVSRYLAAANQIIHASMPIDPRKEYSIHIETDDIQQAIRSLGSALYLLTEEALGASDDDYDESDFEIFARDVLGTLARHADFLTGAEALSEEPDGREENMA